MGYQDHLSYIGYTTLVSSYKPGAYTCYRKESYKYAREGMVSRRAGNFSYFSCGMHEVRSQQVFGAAYVAASAGRMLLGEAKALRPYQVVWLMAKGGGGKSGPDYTNSRQRISECKRVESCVAVAPPSGGHAYPLRISKEGYDPKWSKRHLTGQAYRLPRFDLYRGIDNVTGTLQGRDERLRSRPGFLTGCGCSSCCHLALIPPPAPPEAPPPANKEETRHIDGIPELR